MQNHTNHPIAQFSDNVLIQPRKQIYLAMRAHTFKYHPEVIVFLDRLLKKEKKKNHPLCAHIDLNAHTFEYHPKVIVLLDRLSKNGKRKSYPKK